MNAIDRLFILFDAFATARGLSQSRVSTLVFGAGHKIGSLRAGKDIGARRLDQALIWLSDHWPVDAAWPDGIARPAAPPSVGTTPSEVLSVPVTSDGVEIRSAAGPLSRGVAAAEDTALPGSSSAAARTPEVTA